ncbi:MAG: GIY-YIG nuclease family protein [Ascidiaceihabitans sp.]|nr:GIY-YIG nuclease family protein [Ascidiaceihabitans sp.]
MSLAGRSLELFFIDGKPDGMLTAEVFNWTGHVLRIPRTLIKKGLDRSETNQTGVYVLLGQTEDGPLAYVGEAEDMRTRLRQHVSGKDWWDTAVLITTTGDMLHKAHVKYLESRLVEIARSVGNTPQENASTPPRSSLSEAAVANMESFLDTLNMVLPAIRVDMFLEKARPAKPAATEPTQQHTTFQMQTPKHGVKASAELVNGELIVKSGSIGRKDFAKNSNATYEKLHADLITNGTLAVENNNTVFTKDYAFSSPSAASAVLNGRSSNGRQDWREKQSGLKYVEWEAAQILEDTLQ